jgi:hypothetical protein
MNGISLLNRANDSAIKRLRQVEKTKITSLKSTKYDLLHFKPFTKNNDIF